MMRLAYGGRCRWWGWAWSWCSPTTGPVLAPTLTKGKTIYAMKIKQLLLYLTRDIAKRNYNGCACTHSDKRSNNLSHENQTIVVVVEKGSGEAQLQWLCLHPLWQTIQATKIKKLLLELKRDLVKCNYNGCAFTHSDKRSKDLSHENQTFVFGVEKGSGEVQLQGLHLRPLWQRVRQFKSRKFNNCCCSWEGIFWSPTTMAALATTLIKGKGFHHKNLGRELQQLQVVKPSL